MINTITIKRRLQERGHFTEEQSEDLAETIGTAVESELPTKTDLGLMAKELRKGFGWWAFSIVLGNGAITATLLSLFNGAAG